MAEDEDIGALQRILAKQEALVAKTKARLALAQQEKAALPVPAPPPAAPLPKPTSQALVFKKKQPTLKAPEAYGGLVTSDKGREVGLFSARHKELAALYKGVRDHSAWDKFWDPSSASFVSKNRKINGRKQYHMLLETGEVVPPRGYYFNARSSNLVHEDTVFNKKGVMKAGYEGLRVKGRVLKVGGRDITVTVLLYWPMTYEDEHGVAQKVASKAIYESRKDLSLRYIVDPDGGYHYDERELVLNTTEEALAQWLPSGRIWWTEGSHFKDYVSRTSIMEAPVGQATFSRNHKHGTLAGALAVFSSELSAVQFVNPTVHPDVPTFDAVTLPLHGKQRFVTSPFMNPSINAAATRLEDWIVPAAADNMPTEGGNKMKGQVVQLVLPPDTGCGYEFLIGTFGECFAEHKAKVEAGRKKSRFHDVEMTPQWLYENIFHPGEAYNEEDLGLSLEQLRMFFVRFRVSLFVLDITGRLVEDACVRFWTRERIKADPSLDQTMEALDERLRPNAAYILAHDEHIYPITDKTTTERLTQWAWNANSFLWRPIAGLGKEASGEDEEEEDMVSAPSGRYNLGKDEAPTFFLPHIDALASFNVHQQKVDKKGEPKVHATTKKPLFHDRLRFAVPASMNITLAELVERANYQPRVSMSGLGEILSLSIKVEGVTLSISAPHHLVPEPAEADRMPFLPTEAIFKQYCEHDAAFKASLRPRAALSAYSPSLRSVFERQEVTLEDGRVITISPFYRTPLYYGSSEEGPVTAHDRTKSYTSLLMEMDKVPVFTEFCEFEPLSYTPPKHILAVSDEPDAPHCSTDTLSQCSDPSDPLPQASAKGGAPKPLKTAPFVFKKDGEEPLERDFVLGETTGFSQVVLSFDKGITDDASDWRSYTDANLRNMVASLRGQARSEAYIYDFLTADLGQPSARAARIQCSERDRYSFYLVMRMGTLFPDDPRHLILDKQYCLLTFDTWLLCRDWPVCHTLAVIKPFNLIKTNIKKVVKDMWTSTLPTGLKKFLPNKHVGICGKSDNRKSNTLLFQSASEAKDFMERMDDASLLVQQLGKNTYYFVTQEWRTPLGEGFMPTHHFVLDAQRRVLFEKAVEVGLPVLGVKTDCLYFKGHDPALDVAKKSTFAAIGSWHVEKAADHPVKEAFERDFEGHWLPSIHNEPEVRTLLINDEFDASEFAAIFSSNNHVLVLADIPGAGKTYALKSFMATLGDKALFVTPYNALADDLMKGDDPVHEAITFHRLLGLLAHGEEAEDDVDEEGNVKVRGHDIAGITHIVFDEVFCYNPLMLGQLKRFLTKNATMEDGTARKFYAAGDKNQNAPIVTSCLSRLEMKTYYSRAVSTMFPTQVRLQVCKRVTGKEQQQRIFDIKEAVLNSKTPLLDICRTYFTPITKLNQVRGRAVCYTNETARCVNDYREQRIVKSLEAAGQEVVRHEGRVYYVAQTLRCRKFHKPPRTYINFTYTVTGFERKEGVVTGIFLEETGTFPWALSLVKRIFIYDNANTCHALQGMTASNGVTLFDVDIWCASREWLYTALTRTNDLGKVLFWDPAAGTVSGLPLVLQSDFRQALEARLRGYMDQDNAAGRAFLPEDFIDGDYIMTLFFSQEGKCAHCAAWLPPRWQEKDRNQPTVDRLDNALAHIKGNCCLACLHCNTSRH